MKGFDEFMNLVVDDAVEVRLATKTEEEKRRQLGKATTHHVTRPLLMLLNARSNSPQG
jgi:small nuclear ribonucleoprotein (snRNP)-like protein